MTAPATVAATTVIRAIGHHAAEAGPVAAATAGIDWASNDHAVCILAADGEARERFSVRHDASGLRLLTRTLLRAGVDSVGIERVDGPVVEALLQAGLVVFVIPPAQVKNLRGRYSSNGNKDDRFDAYVLADVVRTDRRRLRALTPDSRQTTVLRSLVRTRRNLVAHRVAIANQLRAHLQTSFPGGAGLFWDVDSAISLQFLERFPGQIRADWLSPKRLAAWLNAVGYSGRTDPAVLHARLAGAPRGLPDADPAVHETYAQITLCFVAVLRSLQEQLHTLATRIGDELALHPDRDVFLSLPRCGSLRAARLLVEIGDARGRFPTADSLICQAGVAPPTRQSGKTKIVTFRWSADRQLRDAVCDFADGSRHANPWAADIYARARARGSDHPHAVRILARAWLHVIWRTWQDRSGYEPQRHAALQTLRTRQLGMADSGGPTLPSRPRPRDGRDQSPANSSRHDADELTTQGVEPELLHSAGRHRGHRAEPL